jgi:hypothetical protein
MQARLCSRGRTRVDARGGWSLHPFRAACVLTNGASTRTLRGVKDITWNFWMMMKEGCWTKSSRIVFTKIYVRIVFSIQDIPIKVTAIISWRSGHSYINFNTDKTSPSNKTNWFELIFSQHKVCVKSCVQNFDCKTSIWNAEIGCKIKWIELTQKVFQQKDFLNADMNPRASQKQNVSDLLNEY